MENALVSHSIILFLNQVLILNGFPVWEWSSGESKLPRSPQARWPSLSSCLSSLTNHRTPLRSGDRPIAALSLHGQTRGVPLPLFPSNSPPSIWGQRAAAHPARHLRAPWSESGPLVLELNTTTTEKHTTTPRLNSTEEEEEKRKPEGLIRCHREDPEASNMLDGPETTTPI